MSPENRKITLEELLAASEEVLRQDYPNPGRVGCPPRLELEKLANFSTDAGEFDAAVVFHITECYPCFTELRELRTKRQK